MKAQSVVRIVVVCPIFLSAMTLARAGAEDVADLMKLMPADMPTSIVAVDMEKFALRGWKGAMTALQHLRVVNANGSKPFSLSQERGFLSKFTRDFGARPGTIAGRGVTYGKY